MSDFDFETPKTAKLSTESTKETSDLQVKGKAVLEQPEKAVEQSQELEFDPKELAAIFDNIMFEGYYEEKASIRGKPVTFRTRTADETMKISKELDTLKVNFVSTLQQHRAMLNLAYSLVNFNGKDLSGMPPIQDRYKFISNLPTQIIARLEEELVKFDLKVDAACRDPENF